MQLAGDDRSVRALGKIDNRFAFEQQRFSRFNRDNAQLCFASDFDRLHTDYWNIEPEPRQRLLKLLGERGVATVLSGHLHRPLTNRSDGILFVTTGPVSFGLPRGKPDGRVTALLRAVGLEEFARALPRQLSGGMAQRVAIARALAPRPEVLLLDEPFSSVDAFTRMHLQDLLLAIWQQESTTMVLVTHEIDEALYLSDRVLVLSGRPARLRAEVRVEVARPRDRRSAQLARLKAGVLTELYHEIGGGRAWSPSRRQPEVAAGVP